MPTGHYTISATVACCLGICVPASLAFANPAIVDVSNTVTLDGGSVEFLDKNTLIENSEEQLSFPYAFRAADNILWMTYFVGTHGTPTERSKNVWSLDNGLTWAETTDQYIVGSAAPYQGDKLMAISGWDLNSDNTTHELGIIRYDNAFAWPTVRVTSVEFPFASQLALHRSLIELESGRLIATAYGLKQGHTQNSVFTFASDDGGDSWMYLSTVASAPFITAEGFDEPAMVRLEDDSLLMLIRTGHSWDYSTDHPLVQSKSSDGGLTWSIPEKVADFGVDPHIIRLTDGTLVASSGRPGVYLLVDYTGTGDHWQEMSVYDGYGSSYTSLVEIEPNVVMLIYAESGFEHFLLPDGTPNRMVGQTLRISAVPSPGVLSISTLAGMFLCMQRRLRSV